MSEEIWLTSSNMARFQFSKPSTPIDIPAWKKLSLYDVGMLDPPREEVREVAKKGIDWNDANNWVVELRGSSPNSSRTSLVIHPFFSMSATEHVIFDFRFCALLAVAGSLAGSLLCFLDGCVYVADAYKIYWTSCLKGSLSGKMVMRLVEAIDVYLAEIVMLIFAVGLYGLFISNAPDSIARAPNPYTLVVTLKDASNNIIDSESCQVGIQQISKAPKQLLVNEHPVVIRGVKRQKPCGFVGMIHQELYTMYIGKQSIAHLVCKEGLFGIRLTRGYSRKMQMVENTGHIEVTLEIHQMT
ncbi:unnamed protein product [Lactuca saligna]|uniref:Uncharacterized protein n=1 Tax=Lactuca saligna TaxID=75948 RepID=A0AA35Z8J7_LACSI|nr:unnamed protein product [Lactuca saligna]